MSGVPPRVVFAPRRVRRGLSGEASAADCNSRGVASNAPSDDPEDIEDQSFFVLRRELGFKQRHNGNHSPHSYNLTDHRCVADMALQFRLGLLPNRGAWRRFSHCPCPSLATGHIGLACKDHAEFAATPSGTRHARQYSFVGCFQSTGGAEYL